MLAHFELLDVDQKYPAPPKSPYSGFWPYKIIHMD